MSRRGKGEDSIYKRANGRWVAQMVLPDGNRKYKTGKTRAIVAAWLADAQQRTKNGLTLPNERITLRAYLEEWLKTVKERRNLKATSEERYSCLLRKHVIPKLGHVPLMQLSVPHLRTLYDELGHSLHPVTVRAVRMVLRTALEDALVDERIVRNVATIVKTAPAKSAKRPILSPTEANRLLEVAEQERNRWEALYWVALNTAMRESELLALTWADVDFTRGSLAIRDAKTEAGIRSPGLIPQVLAKLHAHKQRLMEERMCAGPRWKDQGPFEQGLVFPNTVGRRQSVSDFLAGQFHPLLDRAGVQQVRFHDLRHTAISWLLSLGVSVVDVAHYVGHANAATTLKVYAHALPNSQHAILVALEQALVGSKVHDQAVL